VGASFVRVYEGNTYVSEQGQNKYVFYHTVKVVGLEPEKKYRYKLIWTDESGNLGESNWYSTSTSEAPAVSNFKAEAVSPSRVLVSWSISEDCHAILSYGIGSMDNSVEIAGFSSTFSYVLDNLKGGSTYGARIKATTKEGYVFYSDFYSFTTPPLPSISNLRFESILDRSEPAVRATWSTNVETTSSVFYGPKGGSKQEISKSDLAKDHEIEIGGLADNTVYEIYVKSTDKYGNVAQSDINTFTTPLDTRPPKIYDIYIESSNVGRGKEDKAQIVVSWKTDEPATSLVEYGEGISGDNYTYRTIEDKTLNDTHLVIIPDLKPQTPYHLRVISTDKGGNTSKSEDNPAIPGAVNKSVLNIILDTLSKVFGWLRMFIK